MEVLILLIFISLVFVTGAVAFFAWNVRQHAHQHVDRLALLPLLEDEGEVNTTGTDAAEEA